jgi:hypothetical protein
MSARGQRRRLATLPRKVVQLRTDEFLLLGVGIERDGLKAHLSPRDSIAVRTNKGADEYHEFNQIDHT